jgi:hypothetical protein
MIRVLAEHMWRIGCSSQPLGVHVKQHKNVREILDVRTTFVPFFLLKTPILNELKIDTKPFQKVGKGLKSVPVFHSFRRF